MGKRDFLIEETYEHFGPNIQSSSEDDQKSCCSCCCISWKRDLCFFILGILFLTISGGIVAYFEVFISKDAGASTPPAKVPAQPSLLSLTTESSSLTFTWNKNLTTLDPVTDFTLELAPKGGPSRIFKLADDGLSYRANITGLKSSFEYEIRLRANNSIGGGHWLIFDAKTDSADPPPTPDIASLERVGSDGNSGRFSIPTTGDGGSPITHILLTSSENQTQSCDVKPYNRSSQVESYPTVECEMSGFDMKSIVISSSICNSAGCSGPSNVECLFTSLGSGLCTRPLPKPKPPTDLRIVNTYPLEITWTPPKTSDGQVDRTVTAYDIRLDDPWFQSGLQVVSRVNSPSYANRTVLPGTEYAIQVRSVTPDDHSEWTSVKKIKTSDSPNCGNANDVMNWRLHYFKGDLVSKSQTCGMEHISNKPKCEECLKSTLGLTKDCGGCWYDEGMCTVRNCKSSCLFGSAEKCQSCWDTNCSPNFQSCSGMPTWSYPPLKS